MESDDDTPMGYGKITKYKNQEQWECIQGVIQLLEDDFNALLGWSDWALARMILIRMQREYEEYEE